MRYFLLIVYIILSLNIRAEALSASSAILIDCDSGRVLAESNAYEKRGMASTTKIMTAIVAIEKGDLNDIVTVSHNATNVEGSSMWLKDGEKIPLKSLLYGLMLNSGNDAAIAIAEHIGGNVENFVQIMNETAHNIGINNTHFTNPHGLDNEEHYTTAYDLAQITKYALSNKTFAEIVATKNKQVESIEGGYSRYLNNHNKMLTLYDCADGVKTGFTKKCGRCLVSSATRDNIKLIAVTLNASDDWNDHKNLLDFGFSKFHSDTVLKKGDYIQTVNINNGTEKNLTLILAEDLKILLQDNETCTIKYNIPDKLEAPVIKNKAYGKVMVYINDQLIKSADAVAKYGITQKTSYVFKDKFDYLTKELLSKFISCP